MKTYGAKRLVEEYVVFKASGKKDAMRRLKNLRTTGTEFEVTDQDDGKYIRGTLVEQ